MSSDQCKQIRLIYTVYIFQHTFLICQGSLNMLVQMVVYEV